MGWYCAKTLAENGGHVIMAARSLERTQKAAQMIKVRPSGFLYICACQDTQASGALAQCFCDIGQKHSL